jgi:hypothetical protein
MSGRARFVLIALSFALVVALARAPSASTQGDDVARIDAPAAGASVIGSVEVRGRAATADPSKFSFYRLHYGSGASPSSLRPIGNASDRPVENGVLGTWDTAPLFQGEYTLQLTVYDTSGATTTARVVVNVLPAPTPTPRNQPNFIVPAPGQTPDVPQDDTGPTPTPLPELPQLDPQIPQIDIPQQNPGQPQIQQVNPPPPGPGFQPIQIDQGPQPQQAPLPPLQGPSQSSGPSQFDPGQPLSPQQPSFNPINPVNPSGPSTGPVIAPYEPPPTLPLPPTPTIFGLPP